MRARGRRAPRPCGAAAAGAAADELVALRGRPPLWQGGKAGRRRNTKNPHNTVGGGGRSSPAGPLCPHTFPEHMHRLCRFFVTGAGERQSGGTIHGA